MCFMFKIYGFFSAIIRLDFFCFSRFFSKLGNPNWYIGSTYSENVINNIDRMSSYLTKKLLKELKINDIIILGDFFVL